MKQPYFTRLMAEVSQFWGSLFGPGPASECGHAFTAFIVCMVFLFATPIMVLWCLIVSYRNERRNRSGGPLNLLTAAEIDRSGYPAPVRNL